MGNSKPTPIDTPPPPVGNPRPFPTFPRSKDANPRIFALLVGINDYQTPVTSLDGCIEDINLVANYLIEKYGEDKTPISIGPNESVSEPEDPNGQLHLRILTNAEATYENIIKAFSEHLIAGDGNGDDSYWFHFSGHGTEQFTAEEFQAKVDADGNPIAAVVPNGKDQCLVCYNPPPTQESENTTTTSEEEETDTFVKNNIFLADKELAGMLRFLYDSRPQITEKTPPHIIVTLDCCHSGTGTRDFLEPEGFKTRHHDFLKGATREDDGIEQGDIRLLDNYYGGYYQRMQEAGPLFIPQARHLLMSACTSAEKAGDSIGGGVFTTSLIESLHKNEKGDGLRYLDLFRQTRASARSKRSKQTAQFEAVAGFNSHTAFLKGWDMGETHDYEVLKKGDSWYVRCGAVNGLPTSKDIRNLPTGASEDIILAVYEAADRKTIVGYVKVATVGVQDSKLIPLVEEASEVGTEGESSLPPAEWLMDDVAYVAKINQMPADPFYVELEVTGDVQKMFFKNWNSDDGNENEDLSKLNIFIAFKPEEREQAKARITIDDDGFRLWNKQADKLWKALDLTSADIDLAKVKTIKGYVQKVVRWHRVLALENKGSTLKNAFDLELYTMDLPRWRDQGRIQLFEDNSETIRKAVKEDSTQVRLVVPKANFMAIENLDSDLDERIKLGLSSEDVDNNLHYAIRLKTKQSGLHYYLYSFTSEGAIEVFPAVAEVEDGETPPPPVIQNPLPNDTEVIIANHAYLGPEENIDTIRLKLIVTRDPIDAGLLLQEGFDSTKGGTKGQVKGHSVTDSWYCQTVELTLVCEKGEIKTDEALELEAGNVIIQPHSSLQAGVTVSNNAQGEERSMNANPLQQLMNAGLALHSFNTERSLSGGNVLELSLRDTVPADLATNPLQIDLNTTLADDEVMVPITFDGEFLRIVGDAEMINGKTRVNVRSLPEKKNVKDANGQVIPNPLGQEDNNRSPFKALKLAFFKWSTHRRLDETVADANDHAVLNEVNQLRWAKYNKNGTIERKVERLEAQVTLANKKGKEIILAVHGIIGDTLGIVENLPHVLNRSTENIKEDYLILTYDYENLNTEIQLTAGHLKSRLQEAGISTDNRITIVAHSMGGLVARYLVEQLDGGSLVKHLIMAGTPNSGSPFGAVPAWLGHTRSLLEIGLNFIPKMVPFAGTLLKGLGSIGEAGVLETLEQMKPGSIPFFSELNTTAAKPADTAYSILAGDVEQYQSTGNGFAAFMEKVQLAVGDLANSEDQHDIAVSVDSILSADLWEAREQPVELKTVACHHMNYFTTEAGRTALKEVLL